MPQAMRWLWPTITPGTPGSATPETSRPGAWRCVMYQMPGSEYSRCMSFESSGLPEAVWLPAMAQALEPGCTSPVARAGNRKSTFCGSPSASMLRLTISFAPGGGEVAKHVQAEQQGIHRAPGARLVTQQRELERQAAEMGGDEVVHAAGISREGRAVLRRQRDVGVFGDAPQPQPARFAVRFQPGRAEDFGQIAAGVAPQRVHLPQPVLRRDIALDEERVLLAGGPDMRHAQRVERHRSGGVDGRVDGARPLRQRAPGVPVDQGQRDRQQDGDRDIHVSDNAGDQGLEYHQGDENGRAPGIRRNAPIYVTELVGYH